MNPNTTAIVLAAGRGSRMKSADAKNKVVLHLGEQPMIRYTINTLKQCGIGNIIVVVGFAKESVMAELGTEVEYAHQDIPQGTGHAVKVALPQIPRDTADVIVMYGDDSAFYTKELITHLVNTHHLHQNHLTLVSINKPEPFGLGRIIRDDMNRLIGIVEEKNATPAQKQITEINTGLYCFNADFLKQAISKIDQNPVTQEYYLTDSIAFACNHNYKAEALLWENQDIWYGVNTPEQLKAAEERMKQKNAVQ
jgi:bifunctional UDP-N-acetylglucosamine pyrophosphorylase / glucosamine-1-phosphate N-acetyltransferase